MRIAGWIFLLEVRTVRVVKNPDALVAIYLNQQSKILDPQENIQSLRKIEFS